MMLDFDEEITPRDMMSVRVKLYRRGQSPTSHPGVSVAIGDGDTIRSLYKHASERLGLSEVNRIVNIDGDVLDDIMLISDGDALYTLGPEEEAGELSNDNAATNFISPNSPKHSAGQDNSGLFRQQEAMVGSYVLGKFLGRGSFGSVHIGTQCMTGEQVALKFMSKSSLGSFKDAERVFTEIQCLNSLHHPNVIKLLQVVNQADHMVLALEYASAGDLKEVVDKYGAINEDLASKLFVQILDGVTYCHRQNIVHYDLKLENVLLATDEREQEQADHETQAEQRQDADCQKQLRHVQVKIADFGLSQFANPGQTLDYSAGSLAYIAPEVFQGGGTAGPPRDVWAMGVILFAMMVGRLPFRGSTFNEVSGNIRAGNFKYEENEQVSDNCRQLITGMLIADPEKRMAVSELRLVPWIDRGLPHTRAKTPIRMVDSTMTTGTSATNATAHVTDDVGSIATAQTVFKQHPPSEDSKNKNTTSPHRKVNELTQHDSNCIKNDSEEEEPKTATEFDIQGLGRSTSNSSLQGGEKILISSPTMKRQQIKEISRHPLSSGGGSDIDNGGVRGGLVLPPIKSPSEERIKVEPLSPKSPSFSSRTC